MPRYHILRRSNESPTESVEPAYLCSVSSLKFWEMLYFMYLVVTEKAAFSVILPESFLLEKCTPQQKEEFYKNVCV